MALCKLCEDEEPLPKLIPTKDFNTTGLVNHLVSKHHVLMVVPNSVNTGSYSGVGAKASAKKTSSAKSQITDYFKSNFTMDSLVAELVAKDGISFNTIAKSRPLRRLFNSEFGQLPSSHVTIRRRFVKFAEDIKCAKKKTIQAYIKAGGKYSITLDEWTSGNNRRYLNVNIHDSNSEFVNLGLEPIPASFKSEDCLKLVEKRLESFGLKLQTDIVERTARIQKKCRMLSESEWTDIEEDNQSISDADEIHKEQVFSNGSESDCVSESAFDLSKSDNLELQEAVMKNALDKIRATSKLFRKSPLKNNLLQKQIVRDRVEIEEARECSEDDLSSEDTCEAEKLRKDLLVDGKVLKRYLLPLLERLVPATQDYPNSDEDVSSFCAKRRRAEPQSQIIDPNLPLRERIKLRKACLLEKPSCDEIPELPDNSLTNVLKGEIQKFQESGNKPKRG
ncbi:unnamed protein product, partial [Allacma fusca]